MYSYLIRNRPDEQLDWANKLKKGESHSAESRAKIAASMRGKPKSDDTKKKMRFAASLRWQRERVRKKKLAELMSIGTEPKSVTESFDADGKPIG